MTLQMPSSPLVIGWGLPSSSPEAVTCCAFGANSLTVMLPSALTSGETYAGPPRPPPRPPRPPAGGAPAGGWPNATEETITASAAADITIPTRRVMLISSAVCSICCFLLLEPV